MKEKTKAYAAGLMDAEGCITIGRSTGPRGLNYSARVRISNKSVQLMKWLVLHFGGYVSKSIPKKDTHAVCYNWNLSSEKHTRSFLSAILPYLRIKKNQVEIFFRYLDLGRDGSQIKREDLYLTIRDMKHEVRVTTETPNNSKTDFSYLSGFFDGEGTASLIQFHGGGYLQHAARVYITNTDLPILNFACGLFGGSIGPHENMGKQCYRWELRKNEERMRFLLYCLPYLIVKREEAKIVLEFLRLGKVEDVELRKKFYDRLKKIKEERMIQSRLHGDMQSGTNESCCPQEKRYVDDEAKTASIAFRESNPVLYLCPVGG
jgi:hypothetical protein